MEDEYKIVQEKMDSALMSDDPLKAFQDLLPEINKYNCVDSAWIEGPAAWIQYHKGGKQSWFISTEGKNTNEIEIQ